MSIIIAVPGWYPRGAEAAAVNATASGSQQLAAGLRDPGWRFPAPDALPVRYFDVAAVCWGCGPADRLSAGFLHGDRGAKTWCVSS